MGRPTGTANVTSNGDVDVPFRGGRDGYGKADEQRRSGRYDPWEGRRPSKDTVQRSTEFRTAVLRRPAAHESPVGSERHRQRGRYYFGAESPRLS